MADPTPYAVALLTSTEQKVFFMTKGILSFADQRSQSFSDNHVSAVCPSISLSSVCLSVNFGGMF